jgi:hypothetical protein
MFSFGDRAGAGRDRGVRDGFLVDFFSPNDPAAAIAEQLTNRARAKQFGAAAHAIGIRRYRLDACSRRQLKWAMRIAGD